MGKPRSRMTAQQIERDRARKRRANMSPEQIEHDRARKRVPKGQQLKSLSLLTNETTGELTASWTKTEKESRPDLLTATPPDFALSRQSTMTVAGEPRVQWTSYDKPKQQAFEQFWAACEAATVRYRGIANVTAAPAETAEDLLTLYPLGDPHIGLLAWHKESGTDFDVRIAERELFGVVEQLVERAPASQTAILANLGDYVHAQNDKQLTPTGNNKLDVDGRMAKVNEIAFTLMRRLIDVTLRKHQLVKVVTVPGNHDPDTARMLRLYLKTVYENESRVEVLPNWNPYTYIHFGKNLFGFSHGDGAKPEHLPALMAADQPELWGLCTHRYWHGGHVHHSEKKETPGCTFESHRTLAANDAWHNWKGYRAGKSLSAITYTSLGGEISRLTVDLGLARARIFASVK